MVIIWRVVFFFSVILFITSLLNFILTLYFQTQCVDVTHNIQGLMGGTIFLATKKKRVNSNAFHQYETDDDCSGAKDPFLKHVCEVEAATVFYSPQQQPTVIAKDLSILRYYAQRDLEGWVRAYKNISFDIFEYTFKQNIRLSKLSVLLCLGITSQDKHCLKPSAYKSLSQGQRINQIHFLRDVLWRKDSFCYTLKEALSGYKGWRNFTFPCWVLPQDNERLRKEMQRTGGNYIVKPSFRGEGHGIFIIDSFDEVQRPTIDNYVVQPFLNNPYLVKGKKFDLRTYVLVTSISPLRLYFYKEGLVRFASSKYNANATRGGKEQQYLTNTSVGKKFAKLANLTWTYKKLSTYFLKTKIDSDKVFAAVHNAISRTVLASEFRFISDSKYNLGGYTCSHCYQLLGVDVILDSNLHPIVIEVNGLPSMQLSHEMGEVPNPSSLYTQTKYGLMKDMLNIIYGNVSVAKHVAKALHLLQIGLGPGKFCNSSIHIHCLDIKSLENIITLQREHLLKGDYLNLYPVENGEAFSKFIKHLNGIVSKKLDDSFRTLWRAHHVLTAMKKIEKYMILK